MSAIADDEPAPEAVLREYQRDGRAWVFVDDSDRPVGYLVGELLDGAAHIEQVSVDPRFARRRIGQTLIEQFAVWAKARGANALTLTTFVDVAWNGPYYARCGFRYMSAHELSPGLQSIRDAEAARGLDRWPRACMRRELDVTVL